MTELGLAENYLGAELEHTSSGIRMHQSTYIQRMLQKFGLHTCNPAPTPMCNSQHLQLDMQAPEADKVMYQSLVGGLLYAATISRPDISYAVGVLCRFTQSPQIPHLVAAKRVLRHLKGTSSHGIFFSRLSTLVLTTYADVDYGRELDTRRPISGILHKIEESPIGVSVTARFFATLKCPMAVT